MNLIKFLWSASERKTLIILILSVINGIAGGMLLILIPDAALNIFSTDYYWFYAVCLPVTVIVFLFSKHLSQQKTEALAEQVLEDMVLKITNTVRHTELAQFEQYKKSDILLSIANAQVISRAATKNMESLQAYITVFSGWLYIFFFLSPMFGLFLLMTRFILILVQEMFGKIIRSYVQKQMKEERVMFNAFQNHLYGFKELKFNWKKSDDLFNNYLLPRIEANKKIRIKSRRYGGELMIISILFNMMTMVCCTSFPIAFAPGVVMRIVIILLFTLQSDMLINSSKQSIAEGNVALARLLRLFKKQSLKKIDEDMDIKFQRPLSDFNSITMRDIRFTYPVAHDVQGFSIHIKDLDIKSGEILFIIGGNGSGKSTLINVLTGLYPPDTGVIKIDNDLVSMSAYRHMFTAVFADFHLFDRFYGMEAVDELHVEKLLKLTGLDGKTRYDKNGFTTLDLSTGQRKRLALVIAMIEDRPIYVFDEWAADQDPHFRHYFYENILPSLKKRGKTVIAITHDDRYFHVADKLIRMEYGKVAEHWRPEGEKPVHTLFSNTEMPFSKEKPPVTYGDRARDDQGYEEIVEESKEQESEQSDKFFFGQLGQIFQEERAAIAKIFGLLLVFALSLVSLSVILVHMPQQESIKGIWYIWFIFLLIFMVIAFRSLQKNFYQTVENRIADLRVRVMDHARKTDLLTLKKVGTGKIYSVLTSDIRAIADTSDIILLCLQGGLRMSMIYVYIAILYPPAFILMLFLSAIGAGLYFLNHIKMIQLFEQTRNQEKKLFEAVTHLLEGFKELKLNNKKSDDFYHTSIRHHVSRLRQLKLRSVHYYIHNSTVTYGFWKGILLMMILVMPFFGFPELILPIAVALVITMPLRQVIDRYSQFHMAYLSIQRLFEFENTMTSLGQETMGTPPPEVTKKYQTIQYEDIFFAYRTRDRHPFTVGPLSSSFKAGEVVFITGGNGSGKSTLLNMMTRLYYTDSGRALLNNEKETDIQTFREIFSPIFNDFHLFDRLYGMEDIDEAKLNNLLQLFKLEKRVQWLDGKFTTLDLSTGQKKRLALITTMMEDRPVYVFDEWAADQDPHFREFFYMKLLPEFKAQGKTVIAVTHDDRYFHVADRVLNLVYGRLAYTDNLSESKDGVS